VAVSLSSVLLSTRRTSPEGSYIVWIGKEDIFGSTECSEQL
jgi:hypothetical protein